jgi:hypothetical protein
MFNAFPLFPKPSHTLMTSPSSTLKFRSGAEHYQPIEAAGKDAPKCNGQSCHGGSITDRLNYLG